MTSKLVLGTANFGQPYGLYGNEKCFGEAYIERILNQANEQEVKWIDTAETYGTTIKTLFKSKNICKFNVINKIKPKKTMNLSKNLVLFGDAILLHVDPSLLIQTSEYIPSPPQMASN